MKHFFSALPAMMLALAVTLSGGWTGVFAAQRQQAEPGGGHMAKPYLQALARAALDRLGPAYLTPHKSADQAIPAKARASASAHKAPTPNTPPAPAVPSARPMPPEKGVPGLLLGRYGHETSAHLIWLAVRHRLGGGVAAATPVIRGRQGVRPLVMGDRHGNPWRWPPGVPVSRNGELALFLVDLDQPDRLSILCDRALAPAFPCHGDTFGQAAQEGG
ncbi:hypothetical protein [Yunchengibacter salinarum]|uniref:hypothetical protein n=1 Tax=Yunchengibacter salinarum TaxID=3133399 RepID=UPI0035B6AAE4